MAFQKYQVKDNAYGNLLGGISAVTTTINLESGNGARFPSANFIATLVKYTTTGDDTTPILAKEKILVTNRSTDTLTVTRGFDGDSPTAFDTGDNIYLNIVASIVEDIQDEVTSLGSNKLNASGGTRTGLATNKIIYTNNSGVETTVSLGGNGTYLQSQGATSAPIFATPPLDVNGQTTVTVLNRANDFVPIYDASSGGTRKIAVSYIANTASETLAGLVERATDAEANAGTDTTRYVTPAQLSTYATPKTRVITADIVFADSTTSVSIAHGCSREPIGIQFDFLSPKAKGGRRGSNGQYTASDHAGGYNIYGVVSGVMNRDETGQNEYSKYSVTSVDGTNINLSRSFLGSFSSVTVPVIITLLYY